MTKTNQHCMVWNVPPEPLETDLVALEPLAYWHFEELIELGKEARIWEFFPIDCADPVVHWEVLEQALEQAEQGLHWPFAVRCLRSSRLAGYTRFFNLHVGYKTLEIGSWLHPDFWGNGLNRHSKFLLLQYAFEVLEANRVTFKAAENNLRSRHAIVKLGASFEGILRFDRLEKDGQPRNSACYSIISSDWANLKPVFLQRIQVAHCNPNSATLLLD